MAATKWQEGEKEGGREEGEDTQEIGDSSSSILENKQHNKDLMNNIDKSIHAITIMTGKARSSRNGRKKTKERETN